LTWARKHEPKTIEDVREDANAQVEPGEPLSRNLIVVLNSLEDAEDKISLRR